MRRTAVALVVALVGGLVAGGSASGSPTKKAELQTVQTELKGITRVSGGKTASMIVELARDASVSPTELNKTIAHLSGTGQIAGVILRQDARRPVELLALSIDPCSSPPCRQKRVDWYSIFGPKTRGQRAILPAGRYFLYLIAEGGPAKAELHLGGLGGETTIRAHGPALSEFGQLDPGPTGGATAPVYRATGAFELPRAGIAIAALELEAGPHFAGRYYSCLRPTVEPVPTEAFSLTCTTGVSSWTIITPEAADARIRYVSISSVGEGTYAQTVGLQAAAMPESVSSFGFSLGLDGRDSGAFFSGSGIAHDEEP